MKSPIFLMMLLMLLLIQGKLNMKGLVFVMMHVENPIGLYKESHRKLNTGIYVGFESRIS